MASRYNFGSGRGRGGGRGGRGGPPGGGARFSSSRGGADLSDVVCRSFLVAGTCSYGAGCRYSHNIMLRKQAPAGPDAASVKLRGLSLFNGTIVCNDGGTLRFLTPALDPSGEFVLEGPVDSLLVSGSLVFASYHAAVPGLTAAVSPVGHIRAVLVRPGLEPVQWTLLAPGQAFAHRDKIISLDAAVVSEDQAPVLFSGAEDGLIRMWQLNTSTNLWACQTLEGHARSISSLVWIHTVQRLYSGSTDGTIKVWNPAGMCTGTLLPPVPAAPSTKPGFLGVKHAPLTDGGPSHASVVTGLVEMVLGGQTFLMSGALDGSIKAWQLTTPDTPQLISDAGVGPDDKRQICSMICAEIESVPGVPLLITGHTVGSITIRDIGSKLVPVATVSSASHGQPGHTGPVRVLAQGAGDVFYSGAEDGQLSMWQCVVAPPAQTGP